MEVIVSNIIAAIITVSGAFILTVSGAVVNLYQRNSRQDEKIKTLYNQLHTKDDTLKQLVNTDNKILEAITTLRTDMARYLEITSKLDEEQKAQKKEIEIIKEKVK